jgi:hypothetical protein
LRYTGSFLDELQAFHSEQDSAQRDFFAYMSIRAISLHDADVLANMQSNALFWRTTHAALMSSAFIKIARIFDRKPEAHNTIFRLMDSLSANIEQFQRSEFAARKIAEGVAPHVAEGHAGRAYELAHADIRVFRKLIDGWVSIYIDRYRDVRDLVYAHSRNSETMGPLLERTDFDEMQQLFGFLEGLHSDLFQLWWNGTQPKLALYDFKLPADAGVYMTGGEVVYLQGQEVLRMVMPPDPAELRYNSGDFS